MQKKISYIATAIALVTLAGCGKEKITCSSPIVVSSTTEILSRETVQQLNDSESGKKDKAYTADRIQSALKEISLSIDSIRTSKEEPGSTKVQCAATLKITTSEKFHADAVEGSKLLKVSEELDTYARRQGFEYANKTFSKQISYEFQPTDDGSKVITSVQEATPIADFVSNLMAAAIIKPLLAEAKAVTAPSTEDRQEDKIAKAKLEISEIEQQLDLFKLDVSRYPTTSEGIRALVENTNSIPLWNGPYLKSLPKDPWGENYQYQNPGRNGTPDVFTLGPDKKPGGDDIYN